MNKPRDMLEFFRRAAPDKAEAPPADAALEPTTRMLVLRRSQAIVAGIAAAAALVLAFLLGHAAGGGPDAPAPDVFVIRAASYAADAEGRGFARSMKEEIEKLDLGEEVQILDVPSESRTVVAVGSWLSNHEGRKEARALREKLRGVKDRTQATPFADAEFWLMRR